VSAGGPRARRLGLAWSASLVLGALAFVIAQAAYRNVPHAPALEELSYYPSGQFLKPATLGHAETAADLAWLRAVQYYGEHRIRDNNFQRMPHVFDILTTLAPRFIPAYVFGGFAMAQEGNHFDQAEALMLKGLRANPRSGALAFELGFLYYVKVGGRDLERAAEAFELAARQPDAPPQAARFAAFARQNAGDLQVAYIMWDNVQRTTHNAYLREMAERKMAEIREALARKRPEIAVRKLTTPRVRLQNP
jgi:Flp pilus assembly protein TadD